MYTGGKTSFLHSYPSGSNRTHLSVPEIVPIACWDVRSNRLYEQVLTPYQRMITTKGDGQFFVLDMAPDYLCNGLIHA